MRSNFARVSSTAGTQRDTKWIISTLSFESHHPYCFLSLRIWQKNSKGFKTLLTRLSIFSRLTLIPQASLCWSYLHIWHKHNQMNWHDWLSLHWVLSVFISQGLVYITTKDHCATFKNIILKRFYFDHYVFSINILMQWVKKKKTPQHFNAESIFVQPLHSPKSQAIFKVRAKS